MTAEEFLSHLRSLDVKLWADGNHLRCSAPRAVLTQELYAELKNRKVQILALLHRANSVASSTEPLVRPVSRDGDLPLSFAQQRLWFLDRLEPGLPLYNTSKAVRLSGALNLEALQRTLNTIITRHEILRTNIVAVDGSPIQVITKTRPVKLETTDLCELPDSCRQAEMHRLLSFETRRPFDLSSDLMLRATLLRLGESDHVLLLVIHHIASDGWSMSLLLRELAVLYETFSTGKPCPLPDLPIQYADFAAWQHQWLQGEVLETQLSYWKEQLSGVRVLELPTDRPRPAMQTFSGGRQSLVLPKSLASDLKSLGRTEGVTIFMTLLAAFQTLLQRYTGQDDIVLGSPIAGRTRRETEDLIGFFVNTLVLRANLSDNPSFRELLTRVKEAALGAYAHQDLPFEKLVEELNPERNLSHTPLFQVMFAFQNVPGSALQLPDLTVNPVEVNSATARFDLTLSMMETTDSLTASFEYNTDLFDAATINRMAGHFQTLLQSIAANPAQRLSDLPILTEAERQQLLVEWNNTKRDCPKDKCIHELFEEQVDRSPDAVAVVFQDKHLTYRELNRRANQLAHYLRKFGVGPEVLVGICMERSLEMIVGILGVLKAGGVYVPLDPAYPKDRLAFMLEDSQVRVVLTQERLASNLPTHNAQIVCLDMPSRPDDVETETNPANRTATDNCAYVIYTSGSTGKPKGVLISHSSVAQHCFDIQRHYQLDSNDRVLQFSPLNFDSSLEEILPTLISGARLILRDAEVWDPEEFCAKLSDLQITVANLPTAYWHELVRARLDVAKLVAGQQLRLVIVGSEPMSSVTLENWQQTPLNHVRLLNAYGPTETTITATTFEIPTVYYTGRPSRIVPIGRPLGNRRIYILDTYHNPVPIGVFGELHIGGSSLAQGYLNCPDLTAEKFIPDPFGVEPGALLYKTGDLARYLPDGDIEFLGRIDDQVKIRGFRIELGEIESVLAQNPAVRQAIVVVRQDSPGEKRLVAYVVPHAEQTLTTTDLLSLLKSKLPEYMLPSTFVFLDALPLTPNGKVDRRALPQPGAERAELKEAYVAPRTAVQKKLADIWTEVLKLERLGIHDNFFDIGGHSLKATQVMSRVRAVFEMDVPLRTLFEKPTVEELAVVVMERQAERVAGEEVSSILAEVESLSDEEARRILADQSETGRGRD